MKKIVIRDLAAEDLHSLAQLYKQFWGEACNLENMQIVYETVCKDPRYVFLVADDHGLLTGSVRGVVCAALYGNCKPFMVVDDVIVDMPYRRRGIGKRLMLCLEARALENDCSFITFVTENSRIEAQRFYSALGYDPDAYVGFKKNI